MLYQYYLYVLKILKEKYILNCSVILELFKTFFLQSLDLDCYQLEDQELLVTLCNRRWKS